MIYWAIKLQENLEVQNGMPMKSSEDFSYLQQSQGYGMPHSADPYITSYYGGGGQIPFPYMGEWSAGDSVPYLQGYNSVPTTEPPHHQQPYMADNNMFATANLSNGPQYFNQQALFPHGSEFTAWGAPAPSGHNNVIEPGVNQQNSYVDIYQQSLMQPSYLGSELLPSNSTGSTSNDLLGYGSTGNVSSGSEVTNKLPSESSQVISGLDQNFQNMKLDISNSGEVEKLVANGDASSSLITQNGINENHDIGKIKPLSSEPSAPTKPISWAAIASKPAKPQPKPKTKAPAQGLPPPVKNNVDIGTWDVSKSKDHNNSFNHPQRWNSSQRQNGGRSYASEKHNGDYHDNYYSHKGKSNSGNTPPVLEKLITQNEYNPERLTIDLRSARFFVIKSYSEDDIHRSIKYNIWCSTEHGNKRLDAAFHDQTNRGPVLLLYSVNGSGHFCGVAEMKTAVDYGTTAGVWSQDKWKGSFQVKWIYVKDVPNSQLRHIRLENNDNKPVTNSRDTQEVPADKGRQVLSIIGNYKHQTSIFDDFGHYERKQLVDEDQKNKSAQRERKSDGGYHHSKQRK